MTTTVIWGAVTAVLIVLAVMRDGSGRAFVPWSFPALAGVLTATSLFWSDVESSWLVWSLIGAAVVVAVARFGVAMAAVLVAVVLVFGSTAVSATPKTSGDVASSDAPSDAPAASAPAELATDTCTTWATKSSDYGKLRWFANGIAEIKQADTDAEARAAAGAWVDRVKVDPLLLASAAKSITGEKVSKTALSKDGCATDKAVEVVTEIEADLGQADISVVDKAPSNTTTSGVNGTRMVSFPVTGSDPALKMNLPSGKVIYVEADCGNIAEKTPVFPKKPPKPTPEPECTENCGPPPCTEDCGPPPCEEDCEPPEEEVCPYNPKLPPNHPDCLKPKDPKDDPPPIEGVDPQPQNDPVEEKPPVVKDPIDTDEKPGDSAPDVPAPDSDPVKPPKDDGPPPPPATDEDNTPSKDDPGTEIEDPDAGLLIPLLPLLGGVARLRRRK